MKCYDRLYVVLLFRISEKSAVSKYKYIYVAFLDILENVHKNSTN